MSVIQIILSIIYVILGVAISVVILMQEGKSNGLGSAIGGISTDSYWSKNRGRSMEGALEHFTRYGAIVFMVKHPCIHIRVFYCFMLYRTCGQAGIADSILCA